MRAAHYFGGDGVTIGNDVLISGPVILYGWWFQEFGGLHSATVSLSDDIGPGTGSYVVLVSLSAGESTRDWLGPNGIEIRTGIKWVAGGTGMVIGGVWALPIDLVRDVADTYPELA